MHLDRFSVSCRVVCFLSDIMELKGTVSSQRRMILLQYHIFKTVHYQFIICSQLLHQKYQKCCTLYQSLKFWSCGNLIIYLSLPSLSLCRGKHAPTHGQEVCDSAGCKHYLRPPQLSCNLLAITSAWGCSWCV